MLFNTDILIYAGFIFLFNIFIHRNIYDSLDGSLLSWVSFCVFF